MMRVFSAFWIVILSTLFFTNSLYAAEIYNLDPEHSYITWRVNHFGFSNVTGKVRAQGTLMLDEGQIQNSSVNVELPIANLETGLSSRFDEMLKSSKFFNVSAYPVATFVSNNVATGNKGMLKIQGTLTVHGISKPVTLNVRINKIGQHPYFNLKAAGFSGVTVIKRSEFGLSAYSPGVSDEVKIEIEVEAKKAA